MLINGKTLEAILAEYEKADSVGLKCEQEIMLVRALIEARVPKFCHMRHCMLCGFPFGLA